MHLLDSIPTWAVKLMIALGVLWTLYTAAQDTARGVAPACNDDGRGDCAAPVVAGREVVR
jgi:hypothetical protein